MPARFRNKNFKSDAYYHLYNKGIDGREVFRDEADFEKFESLMAEYLVIQQEAVDSRFKADRPSIRLRKQQMNLGQEVVLAAYCLMPNHFHLLIKQRTIDGITKFMRRVNTGYVMYFNKRHGRCGPLWESAYRGVRVEGQETLLEMTRFIHFNSVTRVVKRFGPVETVTGTRPEDYIHSSYIHYIGQKVLKWVQKVSGGNDPNMYRRLSEEARNIDHSKLKGLMIDEGE